MIRLKWPIALLFILISLSNIYAQQIRTIQTNPQYQSPMDMPQFPAGTAPQVIFPEKPAQPTLQPPPLREPSLEKLSEFEQYISGKPIEITEKELEILKKFERITFQYTARNLPMDKIAVAVKVIQRLEREGAEEAGEKKIEVASIPTVIDAGYLVGSYDAITSGLKILGIKTPFTVMVNIRQFGYDLFRLPPSTFAPVDKVPVGPDYVIGPGDEIKITIWGRIEGQWSVVVDRDGNITIPKIGILGVTGLTFKELKDLLYKEFLKYYTGFEMNVSMGALRTIRVYVVGNAERPGAYTVSSLSTLINALFEVGGPSKSGSMRNIQLKRNGKTLVHFDMYDFLLKGDKRNDVRLMPEDVIFIPPIGPLVSIAGSVNNPAIYEHKDEKTISELIEMAGGLNTIAFKGRVQVERIIDNSHQVVFESNLDEIRDKGIKLQSGDVVKVFQVYHDKRVVRISGAVQSEGEYGFNMGMTVRDLISMAGGPKYYAYTKEAELTRVHITDKGPVTEKIKINLERALAGEPESNILLKEDDYLFIRTIPEWELYNIVAIIGEVKFPGVYTIKKGEKLSSLIERAGGYTDRAYLRGAVFTRERVRGFQQRQLGEMVDRVEKELLVTGATELATALTPEEARIKEIEVRQRREFVKKLKQVRATGRIAIRLDSPELLKKSSYDLELEEEDSLFIPSNPQTVQVIGSVYNQTAFVYDKGKDYSDYIDLAGGYTDYADKKRVYILKADGTAKKPGFGFISLLWNKDTKRWEFSRKDLEPGDTIVVPEKLERIAWLREIKDITQILFQAAMTAGVIIKVF